MSLSVSHDPNESNTDREEVLAILEEAIHDVRDRATERGGETREDEQMQIKWYRTLGALAGQYRMLQRDTDIGEMEDQIELLQRTADTSN